jgi:hypothetical protein
MEVWFRPRIAATIVDIRIILNVKVFIATEYDIGFSGTPFWIVISSEQFSHLSPSITAGNHQWNGAARLLRMGVRMIIGVCGFLLNVNKSSVNVFITVINSKGKGHPITGHKGPTGGV